MLKTIVSLQMLAANKVLVANKDGIGESGVKLIKKFVELKTRKLSKSQKLSKSKNSPNFNTKKNGLSFLNLKAKAAFNRL